MLEIMKFESKWVLAEKEKEQFRIELHSLYVKSIEIICVHAKRIFFQCIFVQLKKQVNINKKYVCSCNI